MTKLKDKEFKRSKLDKEVRRKVMAGGDAELGDKIVYNHWQKVETRQKLVT